MAKATEELDLVFEEGEEKPVGVRIRAWTKLTFITFCYAVTFVTLVHFGMWLAKVPTFGRHVVPTDFVTWLEEKWEHGIWWDATLRKFLDNVLYLGLFGVQHSFLCSRNLDGTSIWMHLHFVYKIDRPLFILSTGLVLRLVMKWWEPLPVVMWSLPWLSPYFLYIHIFAWICLYGTSLMLDLPDMVGFNQVVVNTPTITQKSPDLQLMYKVQRHMGFLPFLIVLLIHPLMTLDRLTLTLATAGYTYYCWGSVGCYKYAKEMKEAKSRFKFNCAGLD